MKNVLIFFLIIATGSIKLQGQANKNLPLKKFPIGSTLIIKNQFSIQANEIDEVIYGGEVYNLIFKMKKKSHLERTFDKNSEFIIKEVLLGNTPTNAFSFQVKNKDVEYIRFGLNLTNDTANWKDLKIKEIESIFQEIIKIELPN